MKKISAIILVVLLTAIMTTCLTACNTKIDAQDAWSEFDEAIAQSLSYIDGKDYYIKYKYKDNGATITQKLNVTYVNSYINDWDDYVLVNRMAEKSYTTNTDYVTTYYGYALKKGVKPSKATKDDYIKGYFYGEDSMVEMDTAEFFALTAGDVVDGKVVTADEEVLKYTLASVLATLNGLNKDTCELLTATKNGTVISLDIAVKDNDQYYGKFNEAGNSLTVQITKGRITKISNADETYYINYAGPKISLVR